MADMDELDGVAERVSSKREYGGGDLSKLPDGEHEFQILSGELKELAAGIVFKLKLGVGVEDKVIEGDKDYWLKGKEGVDEKRINELKADLATLGFDVDNWTPANNRKFTAELKRACKVMIGVKFKGKKKLNESKGKTYLNIYVNARGEDERPKQIGAKEIEEAVAAEGSIPF